MKDVEDVKEGGQEVDPNDLVGEKMFVKVLLNPHHTCVSSNTARLKLFVEEIGSG